MNQEQKQQKYTFTIQKYFEKATNKYLDNDWAYYQILLKIGPWSEERKVSCASKNLEEEIAKAKDELINLYQIFERQFPSLPDSGIGTHTYELPAPGQTGENPFFTKAFIE